MTGRFVREQIDFSENPTKKIYESNILTDYFFLPSSFLVCQMLPFLLFVRIYYIWFSEIQTILSFHFFSFLIHFQALHWPFSKTDCRLVLLLLLCRMEPVSNFKSNNYGNSCEIPDLSTKSVSVRVIFCRMWRKESNTRMRNVTAMRH